MGFGILRHVASIFKGLFGASAVAIPIAPTSLIASLISDTQINLSWTRNSTNEAGFKVERSTNGVDYTVIYTTAAAAITYNDTGLTAETLYYYRVRAYKGTVYSDYTNVASATTYSTIAGAYFAGMVVQPSDAFKAVIDTYFIKNSKTVNGTAYTAKSIIAKADVMYLGNIADSNDSYRNLVKNAHHGTKQDSGLVWDAYWGYSNPAGTGYVDTNYNPSTQGVRYTLNDAGFAVYPFNYTNTTDGWVIGVITSFPSNLLGIQMGAGSGSFNVFINDYGGTAHTVSNYPFRNGLYSANRTSSGSVNSINQNISKLIVSKPSVGSLNANIYLFKRNGTAAPVYYGGLNFTYIGSSLTDDEFTALNLIVNEYLIQCLYLKYGASNWGVQMAKSYFDTLHNFEPYEAFEVYEFIKRHQSDYDTSISLELNTNPTMIDSDVDGLADGYTKTVTATATIVTGDGHVGNAQKLQAATGLTSNLYPPILLPSSAYIITGKYRSDSQLNITFNGGGTTASLSTNTGNAIDFSITIINTTGLSLILISHPFGNTHWMEISSLSIKRVADNAYLYNTFQPTKTIADYIMLFKAGGNLAVNAWTKTGATLRWNQDGTITSSNTMPAYTRGTNLGIVTVTSTDGWNGVSVITQNQTASSVNSFYGNYPEIVNIKTSGSHTLALHNNRFKVNLDYLLKSTITSITAYVVSFPGYVKDIVTNWVNVNGVNFYETKEASTLGLIQGNATSLTSQLSAVTIRIEGTSTNRIDNLTGTLANIVLNNATTTFNLKYSGITGGTGSWNKNIGTSDMSNNMLNTSAVDSQLSVINTYFATNTPIKNLSVNLSGATMGIPSAQGLTDIDGIIAKHSAAGYTAVVTYRAV